MTTHYMLNEEQRQTAHWLATKFIQRHGDRAIDIARKCLLGVKPATIHTDVDRAFYTLVIALIELPPV